MSDGSQQPPAGWYPNGDVQRYWDGTQWTEQTAPLQPTQEAPKSRKERKAERKAAHQSEPTTPEPEDGLRPDIQAAMNRMSYKMGSKREIKRLADHLWEGEQVEMITGGTYGPGTGIVALTDRRLFFLKDGIMSKVSEDFPLEKISSVQWSTGMMLGKITVFISGNKAEINNVQKQDGKVMADAVRARISGGTSAPTAAAPAAPPVPDHQVSAEDVYDKLRKLGELRDAGVLTEKEFAAQKSKLLEHN